MGASILPPKAFERIAIRINTRVTVINMITYYCFIEVRLMCSKVTTVATKTLLW
jgi:hypothetical protein